MRESCNMGTADENENSYCTEFKEHSECSVYPLHPDRAIKENQQTVFA
jgi:hypothetical protein